MDPISNRKWYDPKALVPKVENENMECKCGCTYFEQVPIQQFQKIHNVILGQKVPVANRNIFYVLRCIKCFEVYEPQIQMGPQTVAYKQYNKFLDEMEAPKKAPPGSGEKL